MFLDIIIFKVIIITLKEIRKSKGLRQIDASEITGVPLRTYVTYENDAKKENNIKYKYMVEQLTEYGKIDEETGILSIECIVEKCKEVLDKYNVDFCYLFGSYAKGKARENSDVDLLIGSDVTGLKFFGLVELLRETLHKKVDLINQNQLKDNYNLVLEILKDGIKIY